MEFINQPVSFLAVRENMLQDVPCVQGQGLIASPLLSCTSRKGPHSCWDSTQGSALTLIPASTHCPSWALLEGASPCPACWAEVDHRSLWSPSILVWGWGRVGEASASRLLSVPWAQSRGPACGLSHILSHLVHPRGRSLDTYSHQQPVTHHL